MFFIVAMFVMLIMALYTVRILVSKESTFSLGLPLYLLMLTAVAARIAIAYLGHNFFLTMLAWIGYVSIGVVSILFCVALAKDFLKVTGFAASKVKPEFNKSRREFLAKSFGSTAGLAVFPMSGYGVYNAVNDPDVKQVSISKKGLSNALDGFRIVQLTDIHVGPTIGADTVERIVRKVNELDPDVVVITGDLVDGSADFISSYVKPLDKLKSRHGTFFVTGNHEYYSGAKGWIDLISGMGIHVLDNKNTIINHNDGKILLCGVPDIHSDRFGFDAPNPAKAKETDEDFDISVILSHRPEIADEIAAAGFDIQLSGHTHGGQYFPWTIVIHLFHKYVRGLYDVGDMKLYVSQGTTYWGPPLRLGAESEITEIILKKA
jgi:predicted MPP superfamily phosphohydrolase